jgi:hypothetical protein
VSATAPELTYADLVDAVLDRIPTESGGTWTLHAPVDPGITLVELYAYLLDQRLYWLEQAPPALVRAIFGLLGERMQHVASATTVMRLEGASRVRGGVRLSLVDSDAEVVFTTASSLELLPVAGVGVFAGIDRSADLGSGRGVGLLPADGGPGEARLMLRLPNGIPPGAAGRRTGLLLRLDVPTTEIAPQWSASAVDVPPPAQLTWAYRRTGETTPQPLRVEDGTGGMRRSGIVRFAVPPDWEPDPGDPTSFSIVVSTDAATFTSPPRLLDLVPNAVAASHTSRGRVSAAELERQLAEWLRLPGQMLTLGAPDDVKDEPESVRLALRERDGRWHRWHAVEDLAFSSPADRVFTIDRPNGALRFGDGLTGRIPVPHPADAGPRVRLVFRRGGGPRGNVGDGKLWMTDDVPGATARNAVPATGGADPETVEQAKLRVREAVAANERAVIPDDYRDLAMTTPGVDIARAHVDVGGHPGFPCTLVPGAVTVYVLPSAPRHGAVAGEADVAAPAVDPGALLAVAARLDAARLVGTEVYVRPVRYRAVRVTVTISSPPPDDDDVRARLTADFRTYLDPLVGGEGEGWPFGEPLRPSALLRRAHALLGAGIPIASVAIGLDDDPRDEDCTDVAIGRNELVHLSDVSVRWERSSAADGGLR